MKTLVLILGITAVLMLSNISVVYAQVKIMPIGDSITDLDGSYRCPLYDKLKANGYTVKSVGTESDPYPRSGCSNGGNITHFGFSGVTLQGVRDRVRSSINALEVADYALIHLGTNNYWPRTPFKPYTAQEQQTNLDAMRDLIGILRSRSSQTKILVAQIIGTTNQEMDGYIRTFNFNYLNTLAGQPNVYLVDQYSGYNPASDSYDGVHPQEGKGNIKMADKWLSVMLPLLRNQPVPSVSVTAAPATSPSPIRTPQASVSPSPIINPSANPSPRPSRFDLNKDGKVDRLDIVVMFSKWSF